MKYSSVILGIASTFLLASCNDSMKDVNNSGDEIAASISAKAGQKRQGGNKPEDSGVFRGEDVLKCIENPELCAGDGQLNAKSEVHISSFVKGCLEAPNQCNDKIEVIVALNDQPERVPQESYMMSWHDGAFYYNGVRMTDEEFAAWEKREGDRRQRVLENVKLKRMQIVEAIRKAGIDLTEESAEQYINGYDAFRAFLSIDDIRKLLELEFVLGIERYIPPVDLSLSTAMEATSITYDGSLPNNHYGNNIGIYMSESGCPTTTLSNYTYYLGLSGTPEDHAINIMNILHSISSSARIYCNAGGVLPSSELITYISNLSFSYLPDIYFVNMSCGSFGDPNALPGSVMDPDTGCYCLGNTCNCGDNTYNTISKNYDDFVYNAGITVIAAAGNRGGIDGYVSNQSIGMNVLSVGNYMDVVESDYYVRYDESSFLNPNNTHSLKPEISAPGCNINAGLSVTNSDVIVETGTSQSTAFITGMLSNRASAWTSPSHCVLTPDLMRLFAFQGATDIVTKGTNSSNYPYYSDLTDREVIGIGGVDFLSMYYVENYDWIRGDYAYLAANDNGLNVNMIEKTFTVQSGISNARVVVTWLNRGTYVYDHRNSTLPGGVAYAVLVYDPNNNLLEAELDRYNNFVVLDVDTPVTGTYRIYISRVWSYDTDLELKMAWSVSLQ